MLGHYLSFNGTTFPNPKTPTMTQSTIETVNQSEAGTDLVIVTRAAKRSWDFTFDLSYQKKEILRALCMQEQVSMTYMGTTYTVRLRDFTEQLVEGSEWLRSLNGLYTCTVKVTQY